MIAKSYVITKKQFKDLGACIGAIREIEEVFGEEIILNKENIEKAVLNFYGRAEWLCRLLEKEENKKLYKAEVQKNNREWLTSCEAEKHAKCDENGIEAGRKSFKLFVELYKKEQKNIRRSSKKKVNNNYTEVSDDGA